MQRDAAGGIHQSAQKFAITHAPHHTCIERRTIKYIRDTRWQEYGLVYIVQKIRESALLL